MNRKSSTPIDGDNIHRCKFPDADDEYTPVQRHIIDARLKKSLDEAKRGHTAGPFDTADEMIASLNRNLKKVSRKKTESAGPLTSISSRPRTR